MLTRTFCHIPGIGPATEQRLWAKGVRCWDDLVEGGLSAGKTELARHWIADSRRALEDRDAEFFAQALPSAETWRLFPGFSRFGYVDIETTGLLSTLIIAS